MIYVGMDDWNPAHEDESVQLTLGIERVIDLLRLEFDTVPSTALVATSEDSKNLLLAVHLQGEFGIEDIVVRVNDPQYLDAFADLSLEVVDVASIVGAALAENLQQANDPL